MKIIIGIILLLIVCFLTAIKNADDNANNHKE
jgi:hypothetical protein